MTELAIMQHAKGCLDKLEKGIDPLAGRKVSEEPKNTAGEGSASGSVSWAAVRTACAGPWILPSFNRALKVRVTYSPE